MMALTMIVNVILLSVCFDFYYDLNDDVMMKDIMAGIYTGTPDGHNMQTLYILGALISLCYRLCRNFPWYGLFLFLCQAGSLYLTGVRMLRFCKNRLSRAGCILLVSVFLWGILLSHMVAVQYTVTCAILASAAIFLFMTTRRGLSPKQFIIQNLPSVFLVILAYQLRTEMLLLIFPLIGLAGLSRWMEEEKFFQKENFLRYGVTLGGILAGMAISRLIDFAAYGSGEWKTFLDFFNQRTEVYDFHYDILTSGDHGEYLSSIGLNAAQQELLANYNFGLDETIDNEMLGKIAAYASQIPADDGTDTQNREGRVGQLIKEIYRSARMSRYRILHEEDSPYNQIVLCGYLCVIVCGFASAFTGKKKMEKDEAGKSPIRRWNFLWEIILLVIVRTALWVFLLMRGRTPPRITDSLYLAEFMVLAGMFCLQMFPRYSSPGNAAEDRFGRPGVFLRTGCVILFGILCVYSLPGSVTAAIADGNAREEANSGALAIAEYCKAHPGNFYFEDVYSTVGFSQKMFEKVDNSLSNYDIMGGWMCKSPLYREKLSRFHIETMEEGLLFDPSVYFIMETGTQGSSTDWMEAYYESKGVSVTIVQEDCIDGRYGVYQVRPTQSTEERRKAERQDETGTTTGKGPDLSAPDGDRRYGSYCCMAQ